MKRSFRALSHLFNLILCFCIITTALTGIILGLSDRLLPLPNIITNGLIAIHQGEFIETHLSPIYVLFIGLGVFFLGLKVIVGGRYNLLFQFAQPSMANICRVIALISIIPVTVCVETGIAYRLGTDWFNISDSQTASVLAIHSGMFLGNILSISYIIVTSLGLIILSILSWKGDRYLKQKQLRKNIKSKFEKTYLAEDTAPNQTSQRLLRRPKGYRSAYKTTEPAMSVGQTTSTKLKLIIVLGSIVFLSLLYWLTSAIVVAIAAMIIIVIVSALQLWNKLTASRQNRKQRPIKLHEQEVESVTMLKAIPDSMLRMTHEGICRSYMPAKETNYFVLSGDIVDRHISEFMAPEIATGLIDTAQVSLQTGKTQLFQFPIRIDNVEKLHEARITNIGETEVLILVREIDRQTIPKQDLSQIEDVTPAKLHTEADLLQMLEIAALNAEQDRQNKILICLANDELEDANLPNHTAKENLLQQMAKAIDSSFPSATIFLLEDNNLVSLVEDLTVEQASVLVDDLHRHLQEFFSVRKKGSNPVEFKIGLIEIAPHNSDRASPASFAIAIVDAAKAACQMAKQKVNLKTFW